MPRKSRMEWPGAVYHLINRGNYRRRTFKATSDAPNAWIAERLGLSSAALFSKSAGLAVRSEG